MVSQDTAGNNRRVCTSSSNIASRASPALTLSANTLHAGRVVRSAAAKLPHWIGEFLAGTNSGWRHIMLRMVLLSLLIPLGVGVLSAMELRAPPRTVVAVAPPVAETAEGISDSHGALAKADRLEIATASSETPVQPVLVNEPVAPSEDIGNEPVAPSQDINIGPSEPPKPIDRHRHATKPKKVVTAARPKPKPKAADIKQTATAQRSKAAGDTEPCRLKAFGGLLKALNSTDCEI
jgi:hypothetical protein